MTQNSFGMKNPLLVFGGIFIVIIGIGLTLAGLRYNDSLIACGGFSIALVGGIMVMERS